MKPSQHVLVIAGPHAGRHGQIIRLRTLAGYARVHFDHPGTCDCEFATMSVKHLR